MEGGHWRQSLGTRKMSINRDEEKARGKLLAGIFQMHLQVGACVCAEVANPSRGNGGGGALEKKWDGTGVGKHKSPVLLGLGL